MNEVSFEMRMENKRLINAKCHTRHQPRTHAHNHITPAGIRKPWTAVSALSPGLIIMAKPILAEAGFYNCLGKYRLCNADEGQQGRNS